MAVMTVNAQAPLPNPFDQGLNQFVSDTDNYLSAAEKEQINQRIAMLRKATTVEMAVAIVPTTGDLTIEQYGEKLFTGWKIGKQDNDNGVLLLIAVDDRLAFIQTGYGMEGVLPDVVCSRIISREIAPEMKRGNIYGAVMGTVMAITDIIENSGDGSDVVSKQGEGPVLQGLDPDIFYNFIYLVAAIGFVVTLVLYVRTSRHARKGLDNYDKAMAWRNARKSLWWCTLLSLGTAIIFPLLAIWRSRVYRNRRIKCDVCGAKMVKLGEEEDNDYLDSGQDLEEKLNTVDYDVWVCPECHAVKRYAYKIDQSKYKECPQCHVVAMHEKSRSTVIPPTVNSEGVGEVVYECEHCHFQDRNRYRISKKEDPAVAAAAAVALGAAMRGGSRGGNGFGGGGFGGFGGGRTGGGGARGGW